MDFCYNLSGNRTLDILMRATSNFGDGLIVPVVLVALMGIYFYRQKKVLTIYFIGAVLGGEAIKQAIKILVARPRPGWVGCESLVGLTDFSFPSGHVIFYTTVFGLFLLFTSKKPSNLWRLMMRLFSVAMILLIGFSRVYLGAHWITDVLAGYFIGGIILVAVIYLLKRFQDD